MASRRRSRRPFHSSHFRPLLESLEDRSSSRRVPLRSCPPTCWALGEASASLLAVTSNNGLVPVPLANGGTAWLQGPGALGLKTPASSGSPGAPAAVAAADPVRSRRHPRQPPGRLPVRVERTPADAAPPATSRSRSRPPTGSVPEVPITTTSPSRASRETAPARPSASSRRATTPPSSTPPPQLQHQRPGGLRQDLRPARPAQPDLRRPYRHTAVVLQQQQQQPRLLELRRRRRDRAGYRVGACHAPGASIDVLCATPIPPYYEGHRSRHGDARRPPRRLGRLGQLWYSLDYFGQEALEQNVGQQHPAAGHRRAPERELLRGVGR